MVENFGDSTLFLICSYGYEANNHSHSAFCKETIEEIEYAPEVLSCPAGNHLIKGCYNQIDGQNRVVMEKSACQTCKKRYNCYSKVQSKTDIVNVSVVKVQRAKHAAETKMEEYMMLSSKRNAIKGVRSVLRQINNVDHISVKGKPKNDQYF